MKNIIAITGPSGVGKTTLGNLLIHKDDFVTPIHSTTRKRRQDDEEGFYRYLSFLSFKEAVQKNQFLFWSGDAQIVDQKYGNYYGILQEDFKKVINNDNILIYISYKDINNVLKLKSSDMNIEIINLIYDNLETIMPKRLLSSKRGSTEEEIEKRIMNAKQYEKMFGNMIESNKEIIRLSTDTLTIDETYDKVKKLIKRR